MIMAKQNDYFLNLMENPDFTAFDFSQAGGLNAKNTGLKAKSDYQNLQAVQDNPMFQTNGKFDQGKFDKAYASARSGYNQLANNTFTDSIASEATYYKGNIFAPTDQIKDWGPDYKMVRTSNPLKDVIGFQGANVRTSSGLSDREVMEDVPFYDFTDGKFSNLTPNDTWISNFFDPKVVATYDKDTYEVNPLTNEKEFHAKGSQKIDPVTGTHYYETLGDRDIYGKQVLSGWDTITRDGSFANKYDFFDSDDVKKSTVGSLVKAAIKIAPALIPSPIQPWYVGARVGLSTMDLMGKLTKIFTGSDSPKASYLEALDKSFTASESDDAQAHPWALENIINLSADVFTQLAEQRWIFEQVPRVFNKGVNPFSKEGRDLILNEAKADDAADLEAALLSDTGKSRIARLAAKEGISEEQATMSILNQNMLVQQSAAQEALETNQRDFQKIGEYLSKAYMTGITVADSYGQAKEQGLSDLQASLFTLGYAAGEYKIIDSALGEWILPELRIEKTRMKAIAERLALPEYQLPGQEATKEAKAGVMKKIFNFGKSIANGDYHVMREKAEAGGADAALREAGEEATEKTLSSKAAAATAQALNKMQDATGTAIAKGAETLLDHASTGKTFLKQTVANALGEGTEEASEELLADMSKALFNVSQYIAGNKERLDAFDAPGGDFSQINWGGVANRYALNFVGGVIGGGLGQGLTNYRNAASLKNMDKSQAWQELVYLIREGKVDNYIKTVKKMQFNSDDLSLKDATINDDGQIIYGEGNSKDNMNNDIQKVLIQQAQGVKKILDLNNCNISDESLIHTLSNSDALNRLRAVKLADASQTIVASSYVQEYNSLVTKIVGLNQAIEAAKAPDPDATDSEIKASQAQNEEQNAEAIKAYEAELKEALKERDAFLKGEKTKEYTRDALFELNEAIHKPYIFTSALQYIQSQEPNKKLNELSNERIIELQKEWEDVKAFDTPDKIRVKRKLHEFIGQRVAQHLQDHVNRYIDKDDKSILAKIQEEFLGQESGRNKTHNNLADIADFEGATSYLSAANSRSAYLLAKVADLFLQNESKEDLAKGKIDGADDENHPINKLVRFIGALSEPTRITDNETSAISREIGQFATDNFPSIDTTDAKYFANPTLQDAYFTHLLKNGFVDELLNTTQDGVTLGQLLLNNIKSNKNGISYSTKESIKNDLLAYLKDSDTKTQLEKAVEDSSTMPITELLDSVQTDLADTKTPVNVSGLMTYLRDSLRNNAIKAKDITTFLLDDNVVSHIDNALELLDILRAQVQSARTDQIDFGDLFGYNQEVNKLGDKQPKLAEIESQKANQILSEINNIEEELNYYKHIQELNVDKAFENRQVEIKFPVLLRNEVKHFVINIPDDWKGKEALKTAIDKCELLEKIESSTSEDKYKVNDDVTAKAFQEKVMLEHAINEFFKANEDKAVKDIINSEHYKNLLVDHTQLGNLSMESLDPKMFFSWLATCAAEDSYEFQKYCKPTVEKHSEYAPNIIQLNALQQAHAFLKNDSFFRKVMEAYNDAVEEQVSNMTQEDTEKLMTQGLIVASNKFTDKATGKTIINSNNTDIKNKFFKTFLIEGFPGTGKSTCFYTLLVDIMRRTMPEKLKNVYIVSSTQQLADDIKTRCGLEAEQTSTFDRRSFLEKISTITKDTNIDNLDIEYDVKDRTDTPKYKDIELKEDVNPTFVIVDEVTLFSSLDVQLLNEFLAKDDGLKAIVSGDYDQSTYFQTKQIQVGDDTATETLNTVANNFISTWKLGIPYRANNNIKANNTAVVHTVNQAVIHRENVPMGHLHYCITDDGFYGDRLTQEPLCDSKNKDNVVNKTIANMINDLDTDKGEKIHIVTDRNKTEVEQWLGELGYTDIDTKFIISNGIIQGTEGKYYIFDLNTEEIQQSDDTFADINNIAVYKAFYTAITRAKQGSLIIHNSEYPEFDLIGRHFDSQETDALALNKQVSSIEHEHERTMAILNSVVDTQSTEKGGKKGEKKKGNKPKSDVEDDLHAGGHTDPLTPGNVVEATNFAQDFAVVSDKDGTTYNIMLHTFNANEIGIKPDKNGTIILNPSDGISKKTSRFDNVWGLYYYLSNEINTLNKNATRTADEQTLLKSDQNLFNNLFKKDTSNGTYIVQPMALELLSKLRASIVYNDKAKVSEVFDSLRDKTHQKIGNKFTNTDNLKLSYFYHHKSTKDDFKQKVNNGLYGITTENGKESTVDVNTIDAVFTDANGNLIMSLPIATFTNPITILTQAIYDTKDKLWKYISEPEKECDDSLNDYREIYQNPSEPDKLKKLYDILDKLNDKENNSSITAAQKALRDQIELFLMPKPNGTTSYTSSECMLSLGDKFKVKDFTRTGVQIVNKEKESSGKFVVGKLNSNINDQRNLYPGRYVSNIYTVTSKQDHPQTGHDGQPLFKTGYPFVLISDSMHFDNIDDAINEYIKQETTKGLVKNITRVYVTPPTCSLEDYLYNFSSAFSHDEEIKDAVVKNMGSMYTPIQIMEALYNDDTKTHFIDRLECGDMEDKQREHIRAYLQFAHALYAVIQKENFDLTQNVNDNIERLNKELKKQLNNCQFTRRGTSVSKDNIQIGIGVNTTLLNVMNNCLKRVVFSTYNSQKAAISLLAASNFDKDDIENNGKLSSAEDPLFTKRIEKFKEALKNQNWEGIFYRLSLKESTAVETNDLSFIQNDVDDIPPVVLAGKFDTTALIGNTSELLNAIRNEFDAQKSDLAKTMKPFRENKVIISTKTVAETTEDTVKRMIKSIDSNNPFYDALVKACVVSYNRNHNLTDDVINKLFIDLQLKNKKLSELYYLDINNNTQKAEFGDEKESNNCKDFELTASNQKNNDIELSFTDPTGNSQNELIIIIHTDNNSVEVIKKTPDPKPVATTGTTLTDIDLENIKIADDIKDTMNELLNNPIEFKENLEIFNDALGLGFVNSSNVLNNDFISTVRETVLEKVVNRHQILILGA